MRALLVEPDAATTQAVELMLKAESINVYTTDEGEDAIDLGKLYDYDVILLALNLPDMSGYEVLRTLRAAKVKTPIIIVSGLAGIQDKVKALELGADDYLTKPFHKDELVARMNSVVRRSKGHAESTIQVGGLIINLNAKSVEIGGSKVHLTGKEYKMLELLALRKNTTVTKEMFLSHIYGGMDEPEIKIIDVFICKLRRKLSDANQSEDYPGAHFIETVWGRGYGLNADHTTPLAKRAFNAASGYRKVGSATYNFDAQKAREEADLLRKQLADIQDAMGLGQGATMEEAMEKLRDYKRRAESLLDDPTPTSAPTGKALTQNFQARTTPGFKNGLRQPVGDVFKIGSLIEVDTNEGIAANVETGNEVKISSVVGTILELMSYYQGRELNKTNLIAYIFEKPAKSNDAKLGMYMSQAQGTLTQLVGRELASMIVQVLSGGGYSMARMDNLLGYSAPQAPGQPMLTAK